MQKFIYFTDTHYGARPVNRKDDYNQSILDKLEFIFKLALKNGCSLLHGGDLFDSPKLGYFALNSLVHLLNKYRSHGLVLHTITGNEGHDGHQEQSPLTLLTKTGLIKNIDDYGFLDFENIRIIAGGHGTDPVQACIKYADKSKTNILLTHLTLVKTPVIFDHYLWEDFRVTVDAVCVAHYHPYQGIEDVNGIKFIAPGALSRRKKTKHDLDRIPKCVYIQVDKGISCKEIDIKCKKDIWTNNLKLEIEESISENLEVKEEIKNMKKMIDEEVIFTNIEDAMKSFGTKMNYSDSTIKYVIDSMKGA